MQFNEVAKKNIERCALWHQKGGIQDWSPMEWAAAMNEETGEALEAVLLLVTAASRASGFIKKQRRLESGIRASNNSHTIEEARNKVCKELGDVYLYADLVAQACGLNMEECVVYAFNSVSAREQLPVLLIPEPAARIVVIEGEPENKVRNQEKLLADIKRLIKDSDDGDALYAPGICASQDAEADGRAVGKVYQAPDPRDNKEIMYEACNAKLKERVDSLEKELANMHERAVNFEHNAVQFKKAFEEKTTALRICQDECNRQSTHMMQQFKALEQERGTSSRLRVELNSKEEQLRGLQHMLREARDILKTL